MNVTGMYDISIDNYVRWQRLEQDKTYLNI